jgi:DNA end-binding protein Ku
VMRDALSDRAAIGRLALHGREYLVAVLRRGNAMLMHTLRTAGEVRDVSAVPNLDLARAKAKPDEVRLAKQVLDNYTSGKELSDFTDHYQEALKQMLAAKDEEPVAEAEEGKPTKVVNLMDALRQSLDRAKTTKPAARGKRAAAKVVRHKPKRRAS